MLRPLIICKVPIRGNVRGSRSPVFIKVLDYIGMPPMSQQGVSKVNAPWSARNEKYVAVAIRVEVCACERENNKCSGKPGGVAWCQDPITTYNFLNQLYYISQLHARLRLDRMLLSAFHASLCTVTGAFTPAFSASERHPVKCRVDLTAEPAIVPAKCQQSLNISSMQYMLLGFCVGSIWPQTDVFPQDTKCL